jgi:5-methylcytosine-specific restriction endonuclease McrA
MSELLTAAEEAEVVAFFYANENWAMRQVSRWGLLPSGYELHLKRATQRRTALDNARSALRHAAKLRRTPPWADRDAIARIYDEARCLTEATGIDHHVDHAIPLRGRLVSGLHVHTNLQILTGVENSRKCNHFEIEP